MLRQLLERSVTSLIRVACLFALVGLAVMCASLIWPRALLVIFAMSVGHAIGFGAFASYMLAVVVDMRRARRERSSMPPAAVSEKSSSGDAA